MFKNTEQSLFERVCAEQNFLKPNKELKDAKTIEEAYYIGFKEGQDDRDADLNILLESLDLAFYSDDMDEFEMVRKLAETIKSHKD